MKTTIEIDIPDGYEFVRFGAANYNEAIINEINQITVWPFQSCSSFKSVIVKKKTETRKYKVALMKVPFLEFTTTQDFNDSFNNLENNKYFVKWLTKDWVEYEV